VSPDIGRLPVWGTSAKEEEEDVATMGTPSCAEGNKTPAPLWSGGGGGSGLGGAAGSSGSMWVFRAASLAEPPALLGICESAAATLSYNQKQQLQSENPLRNRSI